MLPMARPGPTYKAVHLRKRRLNYRTREELNCERTVVTSPAFFLRDGNVLGAIRATDSTQGHSHAGQ